jgi:hypothetical protein
MHLVDDEHAGWRVRGRAASISSRAFFVLSQSGERPER